MKPVDDFDDVDDKPPVAISAAGNGFNSGHKRNSPTPQPSAAAPQPSAAPQRPVPPPPPEL